ncbi:MAG: TldD/PmbA family protein [Myxococcota bacterium]
MRVRRHMTFGFNQSLSTELAYVAVEECLRLGASYAEARFESRRTEELRTRGGRLVQSRLTIDQGIGIRTLVRGAWGFIAVAEPSRHDVAVGARRAVELARAAGVLRPSISHIPAMEVQRGSFRTPRVRDPFEVPLEEKVERLQEIDRYMMQTPQIVTTRSLWLGHSVRKILVTSEGSELDQDLLRSSLGFEAGASDGIELQMASFPPARQGVFGGGWERVEALDVQACAERVARQAAEQLEADLCPSDTTTLVLSPETLGAHVLGCRGLFDFDRMKERGDGSLLGERVGSEQLGLRNEPELEGGAGTVAFDDEGVPARATTLVKSGVLEGMLASRSSFDELGLNEPSGAMHAVSWSQPPEIRPSNLVVEGGEGSLDDFARDLANGILIEGMRSFALSERGGEFVAVGERAWEIKKGERVRMLKNPAYRGKTRAFFESLEGVGASDDAAAAGAPVGSKGRPEQFLSIGVRAPCARFTKVELGSSELPPGDSVDLPVVGPKEGSTRASKG